VFELATGALIIRFLEARVRIELTNKGFADRYFSRCKSRLLGQRVRFLRVPSQL